MDTRTRAEIKIFVCFYNILSEVGVSCKQPENQYHFSVLQMKVSSSNIKVESCKSLFRPQLQYASPVSQVIQRTTASCVANRRRNTSSVGNSRSY